MTLRQGAAEEAGEEAPKLFGSIFGGAKRAAQEAEEAAEKPGSPFAGLLGGTRKVSAKAEGAAKQAGGAAARAGRRGVKAVQGAAGEALKCSCRLGDQDVHCAMPSTWQ
jgi:hypothetical protein